MKVMRATMKSYPDLDLKTLTREEIIEMNLPADLLMIRLKSDILKKYERKKR